MLIPKASGPDRRTMGSSGIIVALSALMLAMGTDGRQHSVANSSGDGYLTMMQVLSLILFVFVVGMAVGSCVTAKAYRWATQFAQITAPTIAMTTGTVPTTSMTTGAVSTRRKETRTVMTQSQTRYTWMNATPRFDLLNGKDGAWPQMPVG